MDAKMVDMTEALTQKSVTQTLKEALGFIDTRGWTRGYLVSSEGKCCSLGAIALARGYLPKDRSLFTEDEMDSFELESYGKLDSDPATKYLLSLVEELYPEDYVCTCEGCSITDGIIGWNDSENEASVRAVWAAAIEKAEAEGV